MTVNNVDRNEGAGRQPAIRRHRRARRPVWAKRVAILALMVIAITLAIVGISAAARSGGLKKTVTSVGAGQSASPTPTPEPTATPTLKPTATPEKTQEEEASASEDSADTIEPTDRWNADGSATEEEVASQFMAMSPHTYETPEELKGRMQELQKLTVSGASEKDIEERTEALNTAAALKNLDAMEQRLKNNPLFLSLRDVAGEYAKAHLYGFEPFDSVLATETAALYGDAVSIPFKANPEEDFVAFLWELAERIARDPLYADMWAQTFDELYMYVYNVETGEWELLSVGKQVNPAIHQFFADDKEAMIKLKNGQGEGAWYDLRLRGYGDEVVIEPESFKKMCVFGMLAASLDYLGTTTETPAVYWANTRNAVPNEQRMAAKRTEGNPETKKWVKLGLVRKEESPVGAGLVEYEVWVNLTDGRTGIPGEPTVPNTAPPVPVRPDNPYVPTVTPTPSTSTTPTPTPGQGGPEPTPTPPGTWVIVTPEPNPTATPIPQTTPPTGNPDITPTPTPGKRPEEIIADDHPNRVDSDGGFNPAAQEDEEDDLDSVEDHRDGYTDDDGDYVQPADQWNLGDQDDSWTYQGYIEEDTSSGQTQTGTVTPSASNDWTPFYADSDGQWDAAPDTYSAPADCNGINGFQDELAGVIDDTTDYTVPIRTDTPADTWEAVTQTNDQDEVEVENDSASDGWIDPDALF